MQPKQCPKAYTGSSAEYVSHLTASERYHKHINNAYQSRVTPFSPPRALPKRGIPDEGLQSLAPTVPIPRLRNRLADVRESYLAIYMGESRHLVRDMSESGRVAA